MGTERGHTADMDINVNRPCNQVGREEAKEVGRKREGSKFERQKEKNAIRYEIGVNVKAIQAM